MNTPDIPPSKKPWKDLTQAEVNHFFPILARRAERYGDMAHSARWEFAKYLVAANTGAASGLFLLTRSSGNAHFLIAFFIFCGGALSVGIAYLLFSEWAHLLAEGWAKDANRAVAEGLSVEDIDKRNFDRQCSWRFKAVRRCLVTSFVLLVVGGITAAYLLGAEPHTKAVHAEITAVAKHL
jgi:hypothetical protein